MSERAGKKGEGKKRRENRKKKGEKEKRGEEREKGEEGQILLLPAAIRGGAGPEPAAAARWRRGGRSWGAGPGRAGAEGAGKEESLRGRSAACGAGGGAQGSGTVSTGAGGSGQGRRRWRLCPGTGPGRCPGPQRDPLSAGSKVQNSGPRREPFLDPAGGKTGECPSDAGTALTVRLPPSPRVSPLAPIPIAPQHVGLSAIPRRPWADSRQRSRWEGKGRGRARP